MMARVLTAQVRHDRIGEMGQLVTETLRPFRQQLVGFEGGWVMVDGRTGSSTAIFLWTNEAHLHLGESTTLFQTQLEQLAGIFTGSPCRAMYEVLVQV